MLTDEQREILPEWAQNATVPEVNPSQNDIAFARELATALLALKEAREVLERVEWARWADGEIEPHCPICRRYKSWGHAADCKLAKDLPPKVE